jgi:hypothetical protein
MQQGKKNGAGRSPPAARVKSQGRAGRVPAPLGSRRLSDMPGAGGRGGRGDAGAPLPPRQRRENDRAICAAAISPPQGKYRRRNRPAPSPAYGAN